ncbi:MAG: phosphoribosylglycinamide formyltransferase [Erysipelotrichaceae bacterium]
MVKIAIFASGSGTNFENIVNCINNETITNASVALLIVDKENCFAIERSKNLNIPYCYVNPKAFINKAEYEKQILIKLKEFNIDLIVLAGYMRIVGNTLLDEYPNKILNIHPAYLPSFPGRHGILDTYEAKAEFGGVTVHYLDEGIDTGCIIKQEKVYIKPEWTLEEFEKHIHALEYDLYPRVINEVCNKFNL